MANLWVTRIEEVRQALHIARETKRLACAIKTLDSGGYVKFAEKWEHESDLTIASFEFFLAHATNVSSGYRFQAWIDVPRINLNNIKRSMEIFGIDVGTLVVPLPYLEPDRAVVVEQYALF